MNRRESSDKWMLLASFSTENPRAYIRALAKMLEHIMKNKRAIYKRESTTSIKDTTIQIPQILKICVKETPMDPYKHYVLKIFSSRELNKKILHSIINIAKILSALRPFD